MIRATTGFIFTPDFKKVLLMSKNRPADQKGKINGVGGKHEDTESAVECITREVKEETGLETEFRNWHIVGQLQMKEWQVAIMTTIYEGNPKDAKSLTDEKVAWQKVDKLPKNMISNLRWLIPLCVDYLKTEQDQPQIDFISIEYKE
jgi:8-oxo-dGTP diphosphatase